MKKPVSWGMVCPKCVACAGSGEPARRGRSTGDGVILLLIRAVRVPKMISARWARAASKAADRDIIRIVAHALLVVRDVYDESLGSFQVGH